MGDTAHDRVVLQLPHDFVGQLLDGLEVLIDEWDYTYRYHAYGVFEEGQMIRECSSEFEAAKIRDYYRHIASEIEQQLITQRDRS